MSRGLRIGASMSCKLKDATIVNGDKDLSTGTQVDIHKHVRSCLLLALTVLPWAAWSRLRRIASHNLPIIDGTTLNPW